MPYATAANVDKPASETLIMTTTPSPAPAETSDLAAALIESGIDFGISAIGAILLLIVGWIVAGFIKRLVRSAMTRREDADLMLAGFLSSFAYYAVIAMFVIAALSAFGIQPTSFAAVLGAMGLAIGLALQGTLGHVASGVMLLAFRPFRIGHYVEAGGEEGTVKDISLMTTELATLDNKKVIIPNGKVWDDTITNYSANATRRLDLLFSIGYDDDIDNAEPVPAVAVDALNEYSVDLTCRVWVATSDFLSTKWALTKAVKEAFDDANITIPYPTAVEYEGIWVDNQKKQATGSPAPTSPRTSTPEGGMTGDEG